MRASRFIAALSAALMLASVNAVAAIAAPSDDFQYKSQFDTAAIPGFENPQSIAVNNQTSNVLILERGQVDQFDSNGNPVNFSGLGSPSTAPVVGGPSHLLLVDNSGGPTQGNFYVVDLHGNFGLGGEKIWSFTSDGQPIGSGPIEFAEKYGEFIFTADVRADGALLVFATPFFSTEASAVPLSPSGTVLAKKKLFSLIGPASPSAFDQADNLYLPGTDTQDGFRQYKAEAGSQYVVQGSTGMAAEGAPLTVDPSTNDLVVRRGGRKLVGVHLTEPVAPGTPYTVIDGLEPVEGAFSFDATGQYLYISEGTSLVRLYHREPAVAPSVLGTVSVDGIRSARAALHGELATNGADTTFYFEYGPDTTYGSVTASQVIPRRFQPIAVDGALQGLEPDTVYHLRLVATNSAGTTYGPDRVIKTYAVPGGGLDDPCPNALARQQTSAQRLPDCRGYELVSAEDTGGYDVESYLVPGQESFPGFPAARNRLLYATHAGAVPGPWNATNKGPDPYLATRGAGGWQTDYKGLPADLGPASGSFSSVLGEADPTLGTFAFAGAGLCSPCFETGLETGLPVRLPSGQLVQGMAGSLDPGTKSAKPEGKIARYFSADGRHLVFASKYAFEPGANTGGSLTVYERDLIAGTTRIVSTDQTGAVLTGAGISELDISADGSRVVVGKNVSTDSGGNEYVRPYMHVGSSTSSVDLAPGSTSGVLYAGMTADGSAAYFTTVDKLRPEDQDSSADLYRAAVDSSGTLDLSLVTTNSVAACNPVANGDGPHWNTTGPGANCNVVAIGGGGGVAGSEGSIYLLSPEQFGGLGSADEPNLYVAAPGDSPQFVATLEPDNPLVLDSVRSSAARRTGDFQVTPEGNFAAFTSALPLTGVDNFGFRSVFRYDAGAGQLLCASCDRTGSSDGTYADDAALAPAGLSVLEDGRLFFNTRYPLVLNDPNGRVDVYELSSAGAQELVSSGTGAFDSGLLTASTDGTDAFFFTHDTLAPTEDKNGQLMKIYDAREEGGFFVLPAQVPCKASDECHGPSSPVPPPPDIKSSGKSTVGNVVVCPKNRVKRRNQCIKRPAHHKKKHKKGRGKRRGKKGNRHA